MFYFIRRSSFFIFLIVFLTSFFIIQKDVKNMKVIEKDIKNEKFLVDKVEKKNSKTYIYSGKYVIRPNYVEEQYKSGDVIKIDGKIKNTLSMKDYGFYLKSKGYDYSIYAYKIKVVNHKNTLRAYIDYFRRNVTSSIDYLYYEVNDIVRALIVSDRKYIDKSEIELFSRVGIIHIISISGFHIVLIASIFFECLFFLSRKKRYIVSSIFTLFYVILVGYNAPCVRAYIFYITYIASILLGKRYDIFSVGFLLSSIYMAINPYCLFDVGFCLSFMSVFSIAMFYKGTLFLLNKIFKKLRERIKLLDSILQIISVTISSQILTAPYVYYKMGVVSTISILANLISVPIISFVFPIMLLGFLFIKITFFRDIFSNIVEISIKIFIKSNEMLIKLPYSYFLFEERNINIVIIYYTFVFVFYSLYIRSKIIKNMNV